MTSKLGARQQVVVQHMEDSPDESPILSQDETLRRPRHIKSLSTIGGILINLFVAICPVYFIVFGVLVYRQDGLAMNLGGSQQIQEASLYGPTIFPVVFAAVVGKALKSVADWKLERGTTVAMIEYLMASRTVSGALVAPFRFRVFKLIIIPLIALWSCSPLGSQASLRVVSTTTAYQEASSIVTYLDVNGSAPVLSGAAGVDYYINAVIATFNSAMFAPSNVKDSSQDLYGHVKIPMIEVLQGMPHISSNVTDGWLSLQPQAYNLSMYSSLIGLPCTGIPSSGNTTFTVETSYFYLDCSVDKVQLAPNTPIISGWRGKNPYTSGISWNGAQMAIAYDPAHYNDTSRPRNLTLWSEYTTSDILTFAVCPLTTTFVEVEVTCMSGQCNATAIRHSKLATQPHTWSAIDEMGGAQGNFFNNFVNTSSRTHIGTSSPIEYYLDNSRSAIGTAPEALLADVDAATFSLRFAQLLNSYWMITLSPYGALGKDFTEDIGRGPVAKTVLGTTQTGQLVLRCDKAWLAVLMLSALTMLGFGMLATVLDARRRGPDLLDLFVSSLRETPYAHIVRQSSLESGSDQVRRLQRTKIRFGDVEPEAVCGYVAIATPNKSMPVHALSRSRLYR